MKKTTYSLLFGALILSINSCKKNDLENHTQSTHLLNASIPLNAQPTLYNGMLKFENFNQYENYLTYLNNQIGNDFFDNAGNVIEDDDEKLSIIESNLGFSSLRQQNFENFENLNEIGWDDISEIPSRYTLGVNKIEESILNTNGSIIIDGNIITYITKDLYFNIPLSEWSTYSEILDLKNNFTQDDYTEINNNSFYFANVLGEALGAEIFDKVTLSNNTIYYANSYGSNYRLNWLFQQLKCSNNMQITFNEKLISDRVLASNPNPLLNDQVKITWGDGTITNLTWSQIVNQNYKVIHTYPNGSANYNVDVEMISNVSNLGSITIVNRNPVIYYHGEVCAVSTVAEKIYWHSNSNTTKQIKCTITKRNQDLAKNISAETEYYEKKNGKFKNVKTGSNNQISVNLLGNIYPGTCASITSLNPHWSLRYNKKSESVIKRIGIWNGNINLGHDENTGATHSVKIGNEIITYTHYLNGCN